MNEETRQIIKRSRELIKKTDEQIARFEKFGFVPTREVSTAKDWNE